MKPSTNASEVVCPKGQLKFPANETQRIQQGYVAYHCYEYAPHPVLVGYLYANKLSKGCLCTASCVRVCQTHVPCLSAVCAAALPTSMIWTATWPWT